MHISGLSLLRVESLGWQGPRVANLLTQIIGQREVTEAQLEQLLKAIRHVNWQGPRLPSPTL